MKNIFEKIGFLFMVAVAIFAAYTAISNSKTVQERDNTIIELIEENKAIVVELNLKADSLEKIQEEYLKKQDSLKKYYDERIEKNKQEYMGKISNIRTLSVDDGIKLLTEYLSEEDSLE